MTKLVFGGFKHKYVLAKWDCPQCAQPNEDIFSETAFPYCENCDCHPEWGGILSPEQMTRANEMWVEIEEANQ